MAPISLDKYMDFNKPYNQKNFDRLVVAIQEKKVVPYIGAGMSMLFSGVYPSWGKFLNDTSEEYLDRESKDKFNELEELNEYEKMADLLYDEMGQTQFAIHLKEIFAPELLGRDNKEFENKSIYLIPLIFNKGLIITTNYDRVIEKSFILHGKDVPVAHPGHYEALNQSLIKGQLSLYKIHGDILEPESSIVLTSRKYNEVYDDDKLIDLLCRVYRSKNLLFLGCSLEKDRPLDLLEKVSEAGMIYYGIVSCSEENLKSRRLDLDNRYRIQGIFYPEGKHECVRIILEEILKVVSPQEYNRLKDISLKKDKTINLVDVLTDEWFRNQNDNQISNLGDRYLPDLHVELSLSNMFNALDENILFKQRFSKKTDKFLKSMDKLQVEQIQEIRLSMQHIIDEYIHKEKQDLKVEMILGYLEKIKSEVDIHLKIYSEKLDNKAYTDEEVVKESIYQFNHIKNMCHEYKRYLESNEIKLINKPYMLLHGTGGAGKSHIIADTIRKREKEGYKSLLFLGQHFKVDKDPKMKMLEQLQLNCTFEEFLEALNKIAEREQKRIIIFIDALNEGDGKKIWKDYLGGIVEAVKKYQWLGLVISIRTEYKRVLIDNNTRLRESLVSIVHEGFSTVEHKAIRKYFDFYGIHYSDVPMTNQEFSNPLFLRLTCEGFKRGRIDLDTISFSNIYNNYLRAINNRLAEVCNYSNYINVVEQILTEIVNYKYEIAFGNNLIPINKCTEIILSCVNKYNINSDIIDELISTGIINKTIYINEEEYIHITYEKIEDFLYSKLLIQQLKQLGREEFRNRYKKILGYDDIVESLAVVISEEENLSKADRELFEIFKEEGKNDSIIYPFISALKWRKTSTITEYTLNYIDNVILKEARFRYGLYLYEVLISIATKVNHYLNADRTVKHILEKNMADRDAIFIPIFSKIYEEGSSINQLLKWCFDIKNYKNTSSETIRLASIMIATFLMSSNRHLRDKSTKALVSLLTGRMDAVIELLKRFEEVDDPYILERLYAVAFGCIVSEQSNEMIEKVALYVYNKIFKVEYVYPNILLRDYAKNIIDYAKYKVNSVIVHNMNVNPPYKSNFPKVPTDQEIEEYRYDYQSEGFKDYYWSQNNILRSMQVEYTRNGQPGGYGDFGRYTFQSYFYDWDNMNYNDLKNIAIKKIFDLGYDVEKHGKFDRTVRIGRNDSKLHERIGKKYQWIALFELAAQVADNYKMKVHTDGYGGIKEDFWKGGFEPSIRDIDPTISATLEYYPKKNRMIHEQLFEFANISNDKWLKGFKDLPNINNMVNIMYEGQEYILLNGWYSWKEKRYGSKDMWVLINSYIVKENELVSIIEELTGRDFMGRWLAEPNINYRLYNKEYFWSEGYKFMQNPYYCGEEWVQIDKYGDKLNRNYEVLLPTCEYTTERNGDNLFEESISSWHKPCSELFNGLQMNYGGGNSILYDSNGEVLCFESSELLGENIGFFIKKDILLKYLREQGYSIVWTLLGEKMVCNNEEWRDADRRNISGVYRLDTEGKLVGSSVENKE